MSWGRMTASGGRPVDRAAAGQGPGQVLGHPGRRLAAAAEARVSGLRHGDQLGEVVLNEWDESNRSCNFRILLAEAGQNRGLGTEATRLVVGYGFERLDLHRISLGVYAVNPRARRAYEKVGFVVEGTRRDAPLYDGAWVDEIVMAVLAPEWAIHRGCPGTVTAASEAMPLLLGSLAVALPSSGGGSCGPAIRDRVSTLPAASWAMHHIAAVNGF